MIHLTNEPYNLTARITEEYYWKIASSTKQIEYRPATKFWNTRCFNAQDHMKKNRPVRMVLICGGMTIRLRVVAIGRVYPDLEQWNLLKGISEKFSDRPWVWAIILGEILE